MAKRLPVPLQLLLLLVLLLTAALAVDVSVAESSESTTAVESSTPAGDMGSSTMELLPEQRTAQPAATAAPPTALLAEHYDVIDVLAATGAAPDKVKSSQTTRIYTTGELNDDFWLKHLGEDFRHAIHLQVDATNDEYNQLMNETQHGMHQLVHHEYLPGVERPAAVAATAGQAFDLYNPMPIISQLGYNVYQPPHSYMPHPNTLSQTHAHAHTHTHTHTHTSKLTHQDKHQQQHNEKQHNKQKHKRQQQQEQANTSQTQVPAAPPAAAAQESSAQSSEDAATVSSTQLPPQTAATIADVDDTPSQLPFKSPFNDYGNRPTREAATEIYQRGL